MNKMTGKAKNRNNLLNHCSKFNVIRTEILYQNSRWQSRVQRGWVHVFSEPEKLFTAFVILSQIYVVKCKKTLHILTYEVLV